MTVGFKHVFHMLGYIRAEGAPYGFGDNVRVHVWSQVRYMRPVIRAKYFGKILGNFDVLVSQG